MWHLSFRKQIFVYMILAMLVALLGPAYYAGSILQEQALEAAEKDVIEKARQLAVVLGDKEGAALENYTSGVAAMGMRVTILDGNGLVLLDTGTGEPGEMDNHADRPEFKAALAGGQGVALRRSLTLNMSLLYGAVRDSRGRVIRLAVQYQGIQAGLEAQRGRITVVAVAVLLVTLLFSLLLSAGIRRQLRNMVRVIENISLGNYDCRLRQVPGKDFMPLASAVNRMARNIKEHIEIVRDQASRLESVLDTMDDGVLVLDGQGRVRQCNRALMENFPEARYAVNVPVVEIVPVPVLQETVDTLLTKNRGEDARNTNKQFDLEGTAFNVHITTPARITGDFGAVIVFRDMSEVQRLERVRRDFVANASHELRTPLTSIQSYAETLAELDGSDEYKHFCQVILKNTAYLRRLIDELLALARLEQPDGENMEVVPVNPRESLEEALSFCETGLKKSRLSIDDTVPGTLRVLASKAHLTLVFRNLVENACRYAPEGSALLLRAYRQNGMVVFNVGDQGKGIPSSDLERVFERFYRVEKHRGQGSTGLGLAICKHIVERLHGHIRVESPAAEAKTLFSFSLPEAAEKE